MDEFNDDTHNIYEVVRSCKFQFLEMGLSSAHLTIDTATQFCLDKKYRTNLVPNMTNNSNRNEALIKFVAPTDLKQDLQQLANERNIALSSLLRLIASEYVKRNRTT